MKYENKPELIKSLRGFLRQRKHVYRNMSLPHLEQLCIFILSRLELIQRYNYWRHCLEVKNAESVLLMILPSESGGHARERQHMLELIAHCKQVASIPSHIYNRDQENFSPGLGEMSEGQRSQSNF